MRTPRARSRRLTGTGHSAHARPAQGRSRQAQGAGGWPAGLESSLPFAGADMADQPNQELPSAPPRRLIIGALLRGLVVTTVLMVLYYLLPLDQPWDTHGCCWGRCAAVGNDDPATATATATARPSRDSLPAPVHPPAGAALRWITGRRCRPPGKDLTSTPGTPARTGRSPRCGNAAASPLGRAARHLPDPPWARPAIEDLPAGLQARAACLLAGALMGHLIGAFLATPGPGPARGPARHPAGLTKAQPCGGSARSRPPASVGSM
jgi:hypothetical protein